MRKTNIVPWSEEWAGLFKKEARLLKQIFQENALEIHHIGSTSIASIGYAKPVIDILVVVRAIDDMDSHNNLMQRNGYEAKGENGIPGRRFFQKGGDNRTHHVHIFEQGDKQIDYHLDFKAYLLAHPEEAVRYREKKLELLSNYPNEHERYQEGKQELVSELARNASNWGEIRRARKQTE